LALGGVATQSVVDRHSISNSLTFMIMRFSAENTSLAYSDFFIFAVLFSVVNIDEARLG
jgi:hypothetical protein